MTTDNDTFALPRETAAWLDTLLQSGVSLNTRRGYEQDRRFFSAWHQLRRGETARLPIPEPVLLVFAADCLGALPDNLDRALVEAGIKGKRGPLAISTLRRRLTGLHTWHLEEGVPSACRQDQIRQLLRRAARSQATRYRHRSRPITLSILNRLIDTCDDSLRGHRDRALLLLGWSCGGRRRAELAALSVTDVQRHDAKGLLKLRTSKTDQTGQGLWVPVPQRALQSVEHWITKADIEHGALFRSINKAGRVGGRLTPTSISRIVKQHVAAAGLDPASFSAHGLRSGFITECELRRLPLQDTMALSGHRSATTALDYARTSGIVHNTVAITLDKLL